VTIATVGQAASATVDALIAQLWPNGDDPDGPQVHAVVDAARDPRLIGLLDATGLERCCLFAGPLSAALRAAAPHLVHLAPNVRFTRDWLQHGWGRAWGVLTIAPPDVSLQQLRQHLRTLLRVRDENGRTLLFRFYDPRVLRAYLPTCTATETLQVFGPVHQFVCESEPANDAARSFDARVFSRDRDRDSEGEGDRDGDGDRGDARGRTFTGTAVRVEYGPLQVPPPPG
jgi:hypothetical protein